MCVCVCQTDVSPRLLSIFLKQALRLMLFAVYVSSVSATLNMVSVLENDMKIRSKRYREE